MMALASEPAEVGEVTQWHAGWVAKLSVGEIPLHAADGPQWADGASRFSLTALEGSDVLTVPPDHCETGRGFGGRLDRGHVLPFGA